MRNAETTLGIIRERTDADPCCGLRGPASWNCGEEYATHRAVAGEFTPDRAARHASTLPQEGTKVH